MSAININSVVNNKDNTTVTVHLDRTPVGGIHFYCSRIPVDDSGAVLHGDAVSATATTDPMAFILTMPDLTATGEVPTRLYYIFAQEGNNPLAGWSTYQQRSDRYAAVWVAYIDQDDLSEVMDKLYNRLWNNRDGIELRLRTFWPNCKIEQIVHGRMDRIEQTPAIEMMCTRISSPYWLPGDVRKNDINVTISGFIIYDEARTEARLIEAFGRTTQVILNQLGYESMTLATGATLTACCADECTFTDTWNGERFVATFELPWHGQYAGSL